MKHWGRSRFAWLRQRPFWTMYPPHKYVAFRVQTVRNWLDRHQHITTLESWPDCHYCGLDGGRLWWTYGLCRHHEWYLRYMHGDLEEHEWAAKKLGKKPFKRETRQRLVAQHRANLAKKEES